MVEYCVMFLKCTCIICLCSVCIQDAWSDKYNLSLCRLFVWQQPIQKLLLFRFTMNQGQHVEVHCIAVIARFLIMLFICPLRTRFKCPWYFVTVGVFMLGKVI
jgi:hypothetical protein